MSCGCRYAEPQVQSVLHATGQFQKGAIMMDSGAHGRLRAAVLVLAVGFAMGQMALAPVWGASGADSPPVGNDFLRVVKVDDSVRRLDLAVRLYVPKAGAGPTVSLVSAIHVANRSCYDLVQTFLDSQDLVLYEGVGAPDHVRTKADPRAKTASAMRTVAVALERHRLRTKAYPRALAGLLEGRPARQVRAMRAAMLDGWDRPLCYKPAEQSFSLSSLGEDGRPGGTGAAADMDFKEQPPLDSKEVKPPKGIQSELADALGLVFQLEAMDTSGPNFRNSDMTMEQLHQALRAGRKATTRPGDDQASDPLSDQVLQMLRGEGAMMAFARFGLTLVRHQPQMKEMMRLMIMETVSGDISNLARLAPGLGPFLEVVLHDRNAIVLAGLSSALAERPMRQSIAVFFGAGHMDGLQKQLVTQLGYRPAGVFWIPAFEADSSKAGMTPQQFEAMRQMIRGMMGQGKTGAGSRSGK